MGETSIPQRSCKCSDCRVLFLSETGRRRICDECKKQKNGKRVREWKRCNAIKTKAKNLQQPKMKVLSVYRCSCHMCKCAFVAGSARATHCVTCKPLAKEKWAADYKRKQTEKRLLLSAKNIRECIVCRSHYTPSQSRQKACVSCGKIHRRKTQTKYAKRWLRSKRHEDARYRIEHSISSSVRRELKRRGKSKTQQAYLYVGLTGEALMTYLLNHSANDHKRFTEDNYGILWHIDHIRPLASFADSDVELAWDYKNLQPIDSEENLKKGSLFMGMRWRR